MKRSRVDLRCQFVQWFLLDDTDKFDCDWLLSGKPFVVLEVELHDSFVTLRGRQWFDGELGTRPDGLPRKRRSEPRQAMVHDRHSNWRRLPEWLRELHDRHKEIEAALRDYVKEMVAGV